MSDVQTLVFWNKLRVILAKEKDYIFEIGQKDTLNMTRAIRVLLDSELQADEMFCFFDTLFDIP